MKEEEMQDLKNMKTKIKNSNLFKEHEIKSKYI